MSISCFIAIENDITELKQYPAIKKISELTNRFIKNGVDHGYDSPEMIAPDDIKTTWKGQSDYFKELSKKVDLKPLTHVFENFFYTT